jgi:hypothetical protein
MVSGLQYLWYGIAIKGNLTVPDDKPEHCDIFDEAGRTQFNWPLFLLVIAVASALCFWGLGTRTLWEDEAETAVLAQRVLSYGFPKALSGNNLVYQGVSNSYDKAYRWTFHPWGQFYVTAAGLAVFGNTAFAARFPFALCGVLTVALLYLFVWRHWRSSGIAALSALLLATSVGFILHCRQCRYYGLSALTALIVVAVFIELVNNPHRRWWIGFGLALAAQFYTDFGTLMVMLPGLLLSLLLIKVGKKEIIAAAKSLALAFLLIIPGLMLHWARLTAGGGSRHFFKSLLRNIHYFDVWFIPVIFAVPAAGVFIWRLLRSKEKNISEQDRVIIICILVTASAAIGMAKAAFAPYLRYVVPQLSLAKLLFALIIAGLYGKLRRTVLSLWSTRLFLTIVITTLVFTNIFSLPLQYLIGTAKYPKPKISPPPGLFTGIEFAGLMYELTHDFVCCNRVALNVVDDLAEADETVLIDSGDLPLMFYRPDLNIYSLNTLSRLRHTPDLVISYKSSYYHSDYIYNFIQKLQTAHKGNYLCITISVPEELCGNTPEPDEHDFITPSKRFPFQAYIRSDHQDRIQKLPRTIEKFYRYR